MNSKRLVSLTAALSILIHEHADLILQEKDIHVRLPQNEGEQAAIIEQLAQAINSKGGDSI